MKHPFLSVMLMAAALQLCPSCNDDKGKNTENLPEDSTALNWADTTLWYQGGNRLNTADESQPDVFYLLPTCITAWNDESGITHYNADPTKPKQRKAWKLSAELADTIFATHANLYLPYYRQAVFEGLEGEHAAEATHTAVSDAVDAFDYYLKHFNHGRRFILAGYSQGGQMVKEILKHMDDDTYSRLIAAYVVGYGITAADTVTQAGHRTSHIRLAQDSTACGVTINFNSVTTTEAICPLLCQGNIGCINPVSWTTFSTPATLLEAGQSGGEDDSRFSYGTAVKAADGETPVTVSVDAQQHVLIVSNIDPQRYFLQSLQHFFPVGNLHLQELFFYSDLLRHNVLLRSNTSTRK